MEVPRQLRWCGAFLAVGAAVACCAQEQEGSLRGTVSDASHAYVAGADVDLERRDEHGHWSAVSGRRGGFSFAGLPPGDYALTVHERGFAAAVSSIAIGSGTAREVLVTMRPDTVQQSVAVRASGSSVTVQPLDRESSVHQTLVTHQDLETFPLPERSFANIAYLAAGTEPVEPSDPTKARITAVSTGGSSGLNNDLSVDGADDSDDFIGGFLQNFSPDEIEEFAVRTSQEGAETGGTTAGSVVITTRGGSDELHGEAAVYERAAALNARYPIENPAPNPKQPFSQQNYLATLGGPIVRGKTWFFAAFEHVHENASIAYSPSSQTQFAALATLASQGLIPGVTVIPLENQVGIPFRDYLGSLRLDWKQNDRSQWMLRGSTDDYTTRNNLVQQGTLPSTGLATNNHYANVVLSNEEEFSANLTGRLLFGAGMLHLTQARNSNLGFALAFPFSATALTVSGFETFGDNQFATPITLFPSERNQEKYQARYDLTWLRGDHTLKAGLNFFHEPVLGGAFPDNTETLYQFPEDPSYYLTNKAQFAADMSAGSSTSNLGGGFSQNIQRVGLYVEDAWHATSRLTLNDGVHYSTTFGLFEASGRDQTQNPGYRTLAALGIPLVQGAPHDDRRQVAPRLGFAYAADSAGRLVLRGGFGLYFDDLAQNGWATAFQAVNQTPGPCTDPVAHPTGAGNDGCVPGDAAGGAASLIDAGYRTPYAIHVSAGVQYAWTDANSISADFVHEQGNHGYRGYSYTGGDDLLTPLLSTSDPNQATYVPDVTVAHSDNRSSYNALLVHYQGSVSRRAQIVANYTFSKAQTWGCVLGELFDYVNGVCDPANAFGPGDYGPSGEDVRHRVVVAGTVKLPGGVEMSALAQAESARPFTITTADGSGRIAVNGVMTPLDAFRGTPYVQMDMRVSRPIHWGERLSVVPFAELFNVFNRNNPGANYVTDIGALPVPMAEAQSGNVSDVCSNADCTAMQPIRSLDQLKVPGGALGDFFGPGTTVGIPFAAQLGVRASF